MRTTDLRFCRSDPHTGFPFPTLQWYPVKASNTELMEKNADLAKRLREERGNNWCIGIFLEGGGIAWLNNNRTRRHLTGFAATTGRHRSDGLAEGKVEDLKAQLAESRILIDGTALWVAGVWHVGRFKRNNPFHRSTSRLPPCARTRHHPPPPPSPPHRLFPGRTAGKQAGVVGGADAAAVVGVFDRAEPSPPRAGGAA